MFNNEVSYSREELGSFTRVELQYHFGRGTKVNRAKLMRAFIWAEYDRCRKQKTEERNFFTRTSN